MTMHVHRLAGCASRPLAHYLKALAILRLVGEQTDPDARGFWKDESFWLVTRLSRQELIRFFLDEYAPTPLVSPWNGGSGFYEKDNKTAIRAVANSVASRFAGYREMIGVAQSLTEGRDAAPKGEPKAELLRAVRLRARGAAADWVDAAVAISGSGDPAYPALLGTGGNDGRLDFTNNFMQRIQALFDLTSESGVATAEGAQQLNAAVFGELERGIQTGALGQFLPGAGGLNSGDGLSVHQQLNGWDFLLALEGAVCFRSSITRRASAVGAAQASAPFATRATSASYGSATAADESARGEQWMPLWSAPASWAETKALLSEGRSRIGASGAHTPLDFVRSISRMGAARGITAFERYGYQERNGQANLAVPIGRWPVALSPTGGLVDELVRWVEALRRVAADNVAPRSFERVARRAADALMSAYRTGGARSLQHLLVACVDAEILYQSSPGFAADKGCRPIPTLSVGWEDALDDGSPEYRLACVLASVATANTNGWRSVRNYWVPLDARDSRRFLTGEGGIARPPHVVGRGASLIEDCVRVLNRRATDPQRGSDSLGLASLSGRYAKLSDLAALIDGALKESKLLRLAMGMMAIRWASPGGAAATREPDDLQSLPASYALLRLALPMAAATSDEPQPRVDPGILRYLAVGDGSEATRLAHGRLLAAGIRPKARLFVLEGAEAQRMAAALLFPISQWSRQRLRNWLTKPEAETTQHASY